MIKDDDYQLLDSGDGAKLENLVATHLLKRLHFIEYYFGYSCSLNYIRDKDGREVDFAVTIDGVLEYLIEVKTGDDGVSSSLRYYADKLAPKKTVQLVGNLQRSYEKNGVLLISPVEFFTANIPWVI